MNIKKLSVEFTSVSSANRKSFEAISAFYSHFDVFAGYITISLFGFIKD